MTPQLEKKVEQSIKLLRSIPQDKGKTYKYDNAIDAFVATLFFETYQYFYEHTYTLFGKTDWRKYLEDYFKIDLSDVEYD